MINCAAENRWSRGLRRSLFGMAAVVAAASSLPGVALAAQTFQSADMVGFGTGVVERGAGTLTRGEEAVWLTLAMQGLEKKAGYTIWWVVFNAPDECAEPGACGESDLFDPDVEASVFYATGFVTGTDGTANVTAHLHEGDIPQGMDVVIGAGSVIGGENSCGLGVDCDTGIDAGLRDDNGFDAEIHVVIRTHRKTIAGRVDEQIDSFLGACEVKKGCEDKFAVVFSPNPPI